MCREQNRATKRPIPVRCSGPSPFPIFCVVLVRYSPSNRIRSHHYRQGTLFIGCRFLTEVLETAVVLSASLLTICLLQRFRGYCRRWRTCKITLQKLHPQISSPVAQLHQGKGPRGVCKNKMRKLHKASVGQPALGTNHRLIGCAFWRMQ